MAGNPPPAKRVKFKYKETFEVLTGEKPNQQCFTVHRQPFTERSKFLEAATSSRWTSGTNKPVDLIEHEPEVFDSYMQCVYHGSVTVPGLPRSSRESSTSLKDLFTLYLLADKLNDIITTNLIMDKIIGFSGEILKVPCEECVKLAYTSKVVGSPLRRICRDCYVHEASDWALEDADEDEFHFQFLIDVLMEFKRLVSQDTLDDERTKTDCLDREKCYYHQDDDEHPKCS